MDTHIYKDGANVADTVRGCLDLYEYLNPEPPENSLPWQDAHTRAEREEKDKQPRRERPRRGTTSQPATGQPEERPDEQPPVATSPPEVEPAFLSFASTAAEGGALDDLRDPNVFYYDEWDYRIGDYRARWCRVTEREWDHGDLNFARKALSAYRGALSQVRYQFQLMRPAGLRRVRGLVDGDNFDLEAVIEHHVDRRARVTPSDRIYSERQRRDRDVAVFFLIDLSSSTFNRVSGGKHLIDVEKEALLLMSEALEAVGDAYAIYGFSSHGRRHVSFYRFKDFAEPYGERPRRRIGAARWLTNTRLGAAIRHATWRLNQQPSATRLLIILSDGRPADDEYVNERYAREDTRVALAEARASGATPFFIVVNESGSPELEEMLTSTNFTVIDNVLSLPERMPGIYRRLTT
jgi:nitric oxide reductase activation protein